MNHEFLEMCRQRFAWLAEQMVVETIACTTAPIHFEGTDREVPAIVVKGTRDTRLGRPMVRCQVLGIETSECPVLAVGLEFPQQVETLAGWYWSWVPMHSTDQRKLVELMAEASVWLVVVFSGDAVTRALMVGVDEVTRARYRQLKRVVESYPVNPSADTGRAIDAAQTATAAILGDGFELEVVKDIGEEESD